MIFPSLSPGRQIAFLTVFAALQFAVIAPIAFAFRSVSGIWATGLVVVVCWAGVVFAVLSIKIFRYALKKEQPWFIIGGIFRMGIPFCAALVVALAAEKDFGFLVLVLFPVVYLTMLPIDVLMTLPKPDQNKNSVSTNKHS